LKSFRVEQIAHAVGGRIIKRGYPDPDVLIEGVSTDTRTIRRGDIFIPLIGEKFDGHDFLQEAADKGAAAVMTQKLNIPLPDDLHTIAVDNTLKALQVLAEKYLRSFRVPVVAVTGSTGKTTTKEMISYVLRQGYLVHKTEGNYNNEIGLPLTILNMEPYHSMAVFEMGMSGFGEIRRLAEIAPPDAVVFTNIGVSHLEKLGSRENIWRAKSEILENLDYKCVVFLNEDDDILRREGKRMIEKKVPYKVVRYGTTGEPDYLAENIRVEENGVRYTLRIDGQSHIITLNIPGRHNVLNSLAAIAVGRHFGIGMEGIKRGLSNIKGGNMRLDIFNVHYYSESDFAKLPPDYESGKFDERIKVIDDAYNASPDSVKAALDVLRDMEGRRKVAILGDMLELGEDYSKEAHKEIGGYAVEAGVHVLIAVGNYSACVKEGALEKGMDERMVLTENSNKDVLSWLDENIMPGDRILVKGSRGMHMEEIVEYLRQGRMFF